MTHAELVERATRWLRNKGCQVIVTSGNVCCLELPDAIGWNGSGYSILVECKISRSDFRRDLKKWFRDPSAKGIGSDRFYLAPEGII